MSAAVLGTPDSGLERFKDFERSLLKADDLDEQMECVE